MAGLQPPPPPKLPKAIRTTSWRDERAETDEIDKVFNNLMSICNDVTSLVHEVQVHSRKMNLPAIMHLSPQLHKATMAYVRECKRVFHNLQKYYNRKHKRFIERLQTVVGTVTERGEINCMKTAFESLNQINEFYAGLHGNVKRKLSFFGRTSTVTNNDNMNTDEKNNDSNENDIMEELFASNGIDGVSITYSPKQPLPSEMRNAEVIVLIDKGLSRLVEMRHILEELLRYCRTKLNHILPSKRLSSII